MKHFFLTVVAYWIIPNCNAQLAVPGGVKSPLYWFITDENAAVPTYKNNVENGDFPLINPSANIGTLHFRPALKFDSNSRLTIPLSDSDLSKASYFTVYQCTNISKENIIWYKADNQKTGLVLTTSRMADLSDYKYMNYIDRLPQIPKVNTYVQQKLKDSTPVISQTLHLGNLPAIPTLPIISFTGLIPEILIYNRVLSGEELLKISSYLCLKYGITLSEPEATYLNSSGNIIWDGISYSDFHHNIAGIVRDDSSGLLQKTACSSNNPELITISTKDVIPNNSFFLWGDNDLPLIPAERVAGVPSLLQRQGLIVSYGNADSITTDILFDTKQIDVPLPVNPVFWLAIDRSGTGDFSLPGTEYFKMNRLDANEKALFTKIILRKNNNNKERFAFIGAKDILLSTTITSPSCVDPHSGILQIKIWGASFPCHLKVLAATGQIIYEQTLFADNPISIPNIAAGRYTLTINDELHHIYTDTYYINNIDGPQPPLLESSYILPYGQQLELTASTGLPAGITFEWNGPGGFYSTKPVVTLAQDGYYILTANKNGCTYSKEITIKRPPKNIFLKVLVYPNPSNTGSFEVKISLDKIAPVTMSIFSEDGRLVDVKELSGFANYTITDHLNDNGLYYLVLRTGLSVVTRQVIILK